MHVEISSLMRQCVAATTRELADEFRGVFSSETVARYVEGCYTQLGYLPTVGPNFLPVIATRFARERLHAVARSDGRISKVLPEILFVCERNAGRSQMAAGLAHHLSRGSVTVHSAGAHPDERIDPAVTLAMAELGIDISREFPKPLTADVFRAADAVVTLGCGDACVLHPGKLYQDWPIADPAGRALPDVRVIRYELFHRVWDLLAILLPEADLLAIQSQEGESR